MRHDGPKNLFASLAAKVFRDVEVEPELEPLSGEVFDRKVANVREGARSDVRIRSFWTRQQSAFFEFRVFYPFAPSYRNKSPHKLYQAFARTRRAQYEQRINQVDAGSFTPMVMSSTGGIGREMKIAIKHLSRLLAEKTNQEYAVVAGLTRARFTFEIARAALVCLRGSRHRYGNVSNLDLGADLVSAEVRLNT